MTDGLSDVALFLIRCISANTAVSFRPSIVHTKLFSSEFCIKEKEFFFKVWISSFKMLRKINFLEKSKFRSQDFSRARNLFCFKKDVHVEKIGMYTTRSARAHSHTHTRQKEERKTFTNTSHFLVCVTWRPLQPKIMFYDLAWVVILPLPFITPVIAATHPQKGFMDLYILCLTCQIK